MDVVTLVAGVCRGGIVPRLRPDHMGKSRTVRSHRVGQFDPARLDGSSDLSEPSDCYRKRVALVHVRNLPASCPTMPLLLDLDSLRNPPRIRNSSTAYP